MIPFPYRDENPPYNYPYLTIIIIAMNTLIWLLTSRPGALNWAVDNFGFSTSLAIGKPYVLLSSLFLHANLIHLLLNMWFLWLFGDNIEDQFGKLKYLTLYLGAGIAGNVTQALFTFFMNDVPVIGASGAVAGVMGAYLIRFPNARIRCVFLLVIFPFFFRLRALWVLGLWIVFEFINAFLSTGGNVAHWAHIGGFMFGMFWAIKRKQKMRIAYRKR